MQMNYAKFGTKNANLVTLLRVHVFDAEAYMLFK